MGPGSVRRRTWVGILLIVGSGVIAWNAARPYAGSWNDGSRLATVEALVDHGTLAIDHSVFVEVPPPPQPTPYPADDPALCSHGTLDKLQIHGRYYSDKSPVPALLLAAVYWGWQEVTGLTARSHPAEFCRAVTLASSGVAYLLAVLAIYRMGLILRIRLSWCVLMTASFALATVAIPYARHVNNHILLLAVTAWLTADVAALAGSPRVHPVPWATLARMGFLAGLGYTIDLGVGPVLVAATALLVAVRFRRIGAVGLFLSPALPWFLMHHVVNYAVGGSWRPANALAEHFLWPGSPFHAGNITGTWPHEGIGSFLLYAGSMLLGKRGFIGHNLPLLLLLPGAALLRRCRRIRPELLWALGCCCGVWLLYAATSNNSSGQCLSIRWFLPLLAPSYLLIAFLLRRSRSYRVSLLFLSAWGAMLVVGMGEGPWSRHAVPGFWFVQGAALVSWAVYGTLSAIRQRRLARQATAHQTTALPFHHPSILPCGLENEKSACIPV
jgi:hypothetical protein